MGKKPQRLPTPHIIPVSSSIPITFTPKICASQSSKSGSAGDASARVVVEDNKVAGGRSTEEIGHKMLAI